MRRQRYQPPKQSGVGQFVDCVLVMALVYIALMVPLFVDFSGAGEEEAAASAEAVTWESLGQTPAMQAQWEKLGYDDPAAAAEIVTARFDYTIDPVMLILTAVVIVGYFAFVLVVSRKEYREVIAERFDDDASARARR